MAKKSTPEPLTIQLSPEEIATIMALREGKAAVTSAAGATKTDAQKELAEAFVEAIERTKPPTKKTSFNRPRKGPFEAKNGEIKPKLRRTVYHHGLELHEDTLLPVEIELLNKLKPGSYCDNFIRVVKRKDRSLDIDYPIKTASQRLKISNLFKITSFESLLRRLIDEAADPAKYKGPDEDE